MIFKTCEKGFIQAEEAHTANIPVCSPTLSCFEFVGMHALRQDAVCEHCQSRRQAQCWARCWS